MKLISSGRLFAGKTKTKENHQHQAAASSEHSPQKGFFAALTLQEVVVLFNDLLFATLKQKRT